MKPRKTKCPLTIFHYSSRDTKGLTDIFAADRAFKITCEDGPDHRRYYAGIRVFVGDECVKVLSDGIVEVASQGHVARFDLDWDTKDMYDGGKARAQAEAFGALAAGPQDLCAGNDAELLDPK